MNRILAASLALAVATLAGTARADDITVETTPFVSSLSRAEVAGQLQQFRTSGVNPWSNTYNPLRGFQSSASRAQVTADFLRSRDETAALTAEDSGAAYLAARAPVASSAVVAGQPVNAQ